MQPTARRTPRPRSGPCGFRSPRPPRRRPATTSRATTSTRPRTRSVLFSSAKVVSTASRAQAFVLGPRRLDAQGVAQSCAQASGSHRRCPAPACPPALEPRSRRPARRAAGGRGRRPWSWWPGRMIRSGWPRSCWVAHQTQAHGRLRAQRVEVVEVRDVRQAQHGDVQQRLRRGRCQPPSRETESSSAMPRSRR